MCGGMRKEGYYWVKLKEEQTTRWIIAEYAFSCFYIIGYSINLNEEDFEEIGEKIERKE